MVKITLQPDFREFLSLLIRHEVRFLVVGGYAVGVHGYPRFTGDLDIFVAISPENAGKLVAVFREFGFDMPELSEQPFLETRRLVEIGVEPTKIQVMTSISGTTFDEAWASHVEVAIGTTRVPFIGLTQLLKNKRTTHWSREGCGRCGASGAALQSQS
jgi:hypothetical protein